jgi:hypothetical protein
MRNSCTSHPRQRSSWIIALEARIVSAQYTHHPSSRFEFSRNASSRISKRKFIILRGLGGIAL